MPKLIRDTRFYIHQAIRAFELAFLARFAMKGERALLFPSTLVACRCRDFMLRRPSPYPSDGSPAQVRRYPIAELLVKETTTSDRANSAPVLAVAATVFPEDESQTALAFWQHSGEGVSSRRAQFFYSLFQDGHLHVRWLDTLDLSSRMHTPKGPRRYQKTSPEIPRVRSPTSHLKAMVGRSREWESTDNFKYVEERFGRNLSTDLASEAKQAIKRRIEQSIAASLGGETKTLGSDSLLRYPEVPGEDDVFLFPTGMSSISNTHRMIMDVVGQHKCIMFGSVSQRPL